MPRPGDVAEVAGCLRKTPQDSPKVIRSKRRGLGFGFATRAAMPRPLLDSRTASATSSAFAKVVIAATRPPSVPTSVHHTSLHHSTTRTVQASVTWSASRPPGTRWSTTTTTVKLHPGTSSFLASPATTVAWNSSQLTAHQFPAFPGGKRERTC